MDNDKNRVREMASPELQSAAVEDLTDLIEEHGVEGGEAVLVYLHLIAALGIENGITKQSFLDLVGAVFDYQTLLRLDDDDFTEPRKWKQ